MTILVGIQGPRSRLLIFQYWLERRMRGPRSFWWTLLAHLYVYIMCYAMLIINNKWLLIICNWLLVLDYKLLIFELSVLIVLFLLFLSLSNNIKFDIYHLKSCIIYLSWRYLTWKYVSSYLRITNYWNYGFNFLYCTALLIKSLTVRAPASLAVLLAIEYQDF